ncbi:MAG: hypothetical protein HHJ09_10595 [Glaciimonas sp.]|nr:hypothetical protein [Glaciimonas sp.]
MRRNGEAGISWGTAPRLRNGIRLQADMRPARAALITPYPLQSMGRKVSVISHVQEMTERTATRILAKRTAAGRSLVGVG